MDPTAPESGRGPTGAALAGFADDTGCLAGGWHGQPLATQHLTLRRFQPADAPQVAPLLEEWEMARFTGTIPYPYTLGEAERFVGRVLADQMAGRAVVLAVEDRLAGRLVGCVGATLQDGQAELGYWIGHAWWGRGYATEAVRRFLRLLFDDFRVGRVWATVMPENPASRRVLDKTGFTYEGRQDKTLIGGEQAAVDKLGLDLAAWQVARAHRRIVLVAAVALIDVDGRVLLADRPAGKSMAGQWEFPGGKVEPGETPEAALVRELAEELGIGVSQSCLAPLAFASHDYDSFHLLMPLYACRQWRGQPRPREGQRLAWVAPARLGDYPMPPADLPLVALLRDWL